MSLISDHISDFSRTLGLDVDLAEPALLTVEVEDMGIVQMEDQDGSLVLSLSRALELYDDRAATLRSALRSVHFDKGRAEPVAAALRGDDLVFLCRFAEHEIDRPRIEAGLALLARLQDQARNGAGVAA